MKTLIDSLHQTVKNYAEGEVITRNMLVDQKILIIKSGAVFVEVGAVVSDRDKNVGTVKKAGAYLGLAEFVLKDKAHKAQATALHRAEVMSVSLSDFNSAYERLDAERKLSVMADIGVYLAHDYSNQQIEVERLFLGDNYIKFRQCLRDVAKDIGEPVAAGIRFKVGMPTLARMANVADDTARVYRTKMMKAGDIARLDRGHLLLLLGGV